MLCRPQSNVWEMPDEAHEVIVAAAGCSPTEAYAFIMTNCRGDWSYDWMHGDCRSDSPEVRAQTRYLFSDQASAAMFRVRFG